MGAAPHPAVAEKRVQGTLRLQRRIYLYGWTYEISFSGGPGPNRRFLTLRLTSSDELVILLDRLGIDFHHEVVRLTIVDLLRDSYATITEIQLSEKELREAGLY